MRSDRREWRISEAVEEWEPRSVGPDEAGRFLCVYKDCLDQNLDISLTNADVSVEELRKWTRYGLIARVFQDKTCQYCFTGRGVIVANRIMATEKAVNDAIGLSTSNLLLGLLDQIV